MHIVDAHHHLWSLEAVDYPWLRQRGVLRFFGDPTSIQHDYGVADFRRDHGHYTIAKSVHIQVGTAPGAELSETNWLHQQAAKTGLPSAIVAYCDLALPIASETLRAHLAASSQVRGVRQIISRHDNEDRHNGSPSLLQDPRVRVNLRAVADLGLSFDLQLTPPHMLAAARLFAEVPQLPVALCHAGSPWHREPKHMREWRTGLEALAKLPLMACKLSGLGMFDRNWTPESLAPIVATVLDVFGPERVMWGSNFPVDKLYRGYETTLSAMIALVPSGMHAQVFCQTAERFYRI
jgi:predicted TIM-barrel fold metal-dependent hydrolase